MSILISRDDAYAVYVDASQNLLASPLAVVRLCETIFELYDYVNKLEEIIEKANDDQCGCLGGSCRIP